MDKVIKLANTEVPLTLHTATVIHANKYSETHGGAFSFPVTNILFTDIVFRLKDTHEDYKAYVKNIDLPIYTDQEVTVICANKKVIGYIDNKSNYYYYTTRDFSKFFGLGIHYAFVWIIGIAGGVAAWFMNQQEPTLWIFVPLFAAFIFYYIQKWMINQRIRKMIDDYLR